MSSPDRLIAPRRSMVSAALSTYGTNVTAAGLSLLNVLIVARTLGPSGRGDVAFLIAIATLTANLSTLGVQEATANLAAREPALRGVLATNAVLFSACFGALAAVVVLAGTAAVPAIGGDVATGWLALTVSMLPVLVLKLYLQFLAQADYAFAVTNAAWLASPVTTAVANGAMAAAGVLSTGSAIVAWLAGQSLGATILVIHVARTHGFHRPNIATGRRTLTFGMKTHVSKVMTLGNYRADQWFVGAISGSKQLGYYSVAVAWAEVLYYVPGVLVLVQRPDLVRASPSEAAHISARVFRIATVFAAVAAAGLVVFAPLLCVGVFGGEFQSSVPQLRVLALAAFGIVALELLGNTFITQRRPMQATAAASVAFVTTLLLDITLIPKFDGLGAAIATSAAWTVGGIVIVLLYRSAFSSPISALIPRRADLRDVWQRVRSMLVGMKRSPVRAR